MVGAAVIAAVQNATAGASSPSCSAATAPAFAVPPDAGPAVRQALSRTVTWATEEMRLSLRAALFAIAEIRAAGFDLTVPATPPGGRLLCHALRRRHGLGRAADEARARRPPRLAAGPHPDLTGLSCRYAPIASEQGVVLSVIVLPLGEPDERFSRLRRRCSPACPAATMKAARSRPKVRHRPSIPAVSTSRRAPSAAGRATPPPSPKPGCWPISPGSSCASGIRVFGFVPQHYLRQTALNTDFRKFDDGLKLTVDCAPATADQIERDLAAAHAQGICVYGIHRQNQALMTCLVPSPLRDDHVHFVDGAAGGDATAAIKLKAQRESLDRDAQNGSPSSPEQVSIADWRGLSVIWFDRLTLPSPRILPVIGATL